MKKIKLSNGVEMPQLGYGVYQVEPDECERCVLDALSVGYRMIDTAQAYLNEEAVGNAWKKSGVNRDEIFLVSKVWHSNYGEGQTMKSINESLQKLQTDYIDLMLLHQPYCDRYGAYRDLEKAYKAGKIRAIGVSNFFPDHLIDLASNMEIAPMVNQMETHVFNQQHETRKFMDEFGTKLMAWAPLAEGQNGLFTNPTLTQILFHSLLVNGLRDDDYIVLQQPAQGYLCSSLSVLLANLGEGRVGEQSVLTFCQWSPRHEPCTKLIHEFSGLVLLVEHVRLHLVHHWCNLHVGSQVDEMIREEVAHSDGTNLSSLALAVAERRNHHPEDRSQGTNGRESESLRLRT